MDQLMNEYRDFCQANGFSTTSGVTDMSALTAEQGEWLSQWLQRFEEAEG